MPPALALPSGHILGTPGLYISEAAEWQSIVENTKMMHVLYETQVYPVISQKAIRSQVQFYQSRLITSVLSL